MREQRYRPTLTISGKSLGCPRGPKLVWADTGADRTEYPHSGFRLKSGRADPQSVRTGCDRRNNAPVAFRRR